MGQAGHMHTTAQYSAETQIGRLEDNNLGLLFGILRIGPVTVLDSCARFLDLLISRAILRQC